MKRSILFLILASSLNYVNAQEFKSLDESSYKIGDEIIMSGQMYHLGATKILPDKYEMVKRISNFLESHRKIRIEIRCYTGEKISGTTAADLCQKRTKSIYDRLVLVHDISPKRLSPMGLVEMAALDGGVGSQKVVLKIVKA